MAEEKLLPRLIVVPDDLWEAFEGTLLDCGITLICTDDGRSYRLAPTTDGGRSDERA